MDERVVRVVVSGPEKSGRTRVAALIAEALARAGAGVVVDGQPVPDVLFGVMVKVTDESAEG